MQAAPATLSRFDQLKDHGERGVACQAALGLVGAQPDSRERAQALSHGHLHDACLIGFVGDPFGDHEMSRFDRRCDTEVHEVRRLDVISGEVGRRKWSAERKGEISSALDQRSPAPTPTIPMSTADDAALPASHRTGRDLTGVARCCRSIDGATSVWLSFVYYRGLMFERCAIVRQTKPAWPWLRRQVSIQAG